jgi:hypothetical protein
MMSKTCNNCNHWSKPTYDWDSGVCKKLKNNDKIDIEIDAGWEGGSVSLISTRANFGCIEFEEKTL